jgi:hypothetical protein
MRCFVLAWDTLIKTDESVFSLFWREILRSWSILVTLEEVVPLVD